MKRGRKNEWLDIHVCLIVCVCENSWLVTHTERKQIVGSGVKINIVVMVTLMLMVVVVVMAVMIVEMMVEGSYQVVMPFKLADKTLPSAFASSEEEVGGERMVCTLFLVQDAEGET